MPKTLATTKQTEFVVPTSPGIKKSSKKKEAPLFKPEKEKEESSELSFDEETSETASGSDVSDLSSSVTDDFASNALKVALDTTTKEKLMNEIESKKQKIMDIKLSDPRGVLYLGHLPYGFRKPEMLEFFSQFGQVTRIRLARNKKTGKPQHHAFVEFLDPIVAKIVADTMNGYIMFSHVLVCKIIPPEKVQPNIFKNSYIKNYPSQRRDLARDSTNKNKTKLQVAHKQKSLLKHEAKKRNHFEKLGISYQFPGFTAQFTKAEEPVEETKVEETKAEETKAEETKADAVQ